MFFYALMIASEFRKSTLLIFSSVCSSFVDCPSRFFFLNYRIHCRVMMTLPRGSLSGTQSQSRELLGSTVGSGFGLPGFGPGI